MIWGKAHNLCFFLLLFSPPSIARRVDGPQGREEAQKIQNESSRKVEEKKRKERRECGNEGENRE